MLVLLASRLTQHPSFEMQRPLNTSPMNEPHLCQTTANDGKTPANNAFRLSPHFPTTWVAAATEGSSEFSPDDMPDLVPTHFTQAARFKGRWLLKVHYDASKLSWSIFRQLVMSDPGISSLLDEVKVLEQVCFVRWLPEWVPVANIHLPSSYSALLSRIDAATANQDEVRWNSHDFAYTINDLERHHMCLEHCCLKGASRTNRGE